MARFSFLLTFLLYGFALSAQNTMSLLSDTIRISGVHDTGELVVRNRTRSVPGVLFNKGNGITEFRALKFLRVGDSSLMILGQDTVSVTGGGGGGGYVYTGEPDVLLGIKPYDATHMQLRWWKTDGDLYQSAKIGVIGDSQGKGDYPSSYQYSIIGRLQNFIYSVANNDAVTNYCQNGYNSRRLAPTGSNPYVDNQYNITKALADGNKIIILCNTSNDFYSGGAGGVTPVAEAMANTLLIEDACEKAGATLFVVSTFPRQQVDPVRWDSLRIMADMLNQKFGNRCAYVYHLIEDPAHPNQLNPILQYGDNIHLIDAGANIVYSAIRDMLTSYFTSNTTVSKYQLQRAGFYNGLFNDYQYITTPNSPSTILATDSNFYRVRVVYNNGYFSKWSNIIQGTLAQQEGGVNKAPLLTVNDPQTIFLPTNATTLTANASDANPGGTIASYNWFRILGGSATIGSPGAATTTITGLSEGNYVFRCQVTNALGLSTYADAFVSVIVPDSNNSAAKFNFNTSAQNISGWIDVSGGPVNAANLNKIWTDNVHNISLVNLTTSTAKWGVDQFGNSANDNGTFVPDAGGYPIPAGVIQSGWYAASIFYVDNTSDQLKVSGLSPAKRYKLKFYSSLKPDYNLDANPTVVLLNDNLVDQKQVNAVGNTSNAIIFRGIVPNAGGEIPIFVGALQGQSVFGMLNGLVVQEDVLQGSPVAPVVTSAGDKTLQLPSNATTISVTASSEDAALVSIAWTKVSGPGSPVIVSASNPTTNISNLSAGTYVFRCTVVDGYGISSYADVQVVVSPANSDPKLYVGVSGTSYTETDWTVLAGSPASNVITTSASFAGSTVGLSTVSIGNWVPFMSFYSADATGETVDDGGGFLAPTRVQQGNYFNENAYNSSTPQLQVTNLPAGTYTVTMFGSLRSAFTGINCNTEFRVNGSAPVTINTSANTSHAATFTGITVAANGTLNLFFNPTTPNSDANLGVLSYFIIDKTN